MFGAYCMHAGPVEEYGAAAIFRLDTFGVFWHSALLLYRSVAKET